MDEVDYDGRTALHLCATEGHEEIVQFLLYRCHARTDIKDRFDFYPLSALLSFSSSVIIWF